MYFIVHVYFVGVFKIWLLDTEVIIWAAKSEEGIDLLILSL
jgi:hypothetical protein